MTADTNLTIRRVAPITNALIRLSAAHELSPGETLRFAAAVKSWHDRTPYSYMFILHQLDAVDDLRKWVETEEAA